MRRELREELGLEAAVRHVESGAAHSSSTTPPLVELVLQKEEVEWSRWMDLEDVCKLTASENFTPTGLTVLQRHLAN
eukprot:SM000146S00991  [mRNA]  locus=s146:252585:253325:- [translate_table: standard]